MKIAIIFPRFTGPYGGENIALNTANDLVKLGHKVDLYTIFFSPVCHEFIHKGVCIKEGPKINIASHNLGTLVAYFTMPWLASKVKGNYDLILGQTWQAALALWWLRKIKRNKNKLVYHCFEPPRFIYDLKSERGILAKTISPLVRVIDKASVKSGAEIIVSISDLVQSWVRDFYGQESIIAYPGVEVARFQKFTKAEARQKLGFKKDDEIFLSVSKLHPRKRLKWAMRIYKKKRRDENSILIIAGSGLYKEALETYAQKIGIAEQAKFIGIITGDDVVSYNAAADYFLFTAKNEPYGIAPQEAKVAGAKVLPRERPYPILTWHESTNRLLEAIDKAKAHNEE